MFVKEDEKLPNGEIEMNRGITGVDILGISDIEQLVKKTEEKNFEDLDTAIKSFGFENYLQYENFNFNREVWLSW